MSSKFYTGCYRKTQLLRVLTKYSLEICLKNSPISLPQFYTIQSPIMYNLSCIVILTKPETFTNRTMYSSSKSPQRRSSSLADYSAFWKQIFLSSSKRTSNVFSDSKGFNFFLLHLFSNASIQITAVKNDQLTLLYFKPKQSQLHVLKKTKRSTKCSWQFSHKEW